LLHKEDANQGDYAIIHILQRSNKSEKKRLLHIYRQLRNAEPPDERNARGIIDKLFFSDQRYNLGEVGRRINKNWFRYSNGKAKTKEDIITM
jgi:DNA-directed RNA polymerase subunit beta